MAVCPLGLQLVLDSPSPSPSPPPPPPLPPSSNDTDVETLDTQLQNLNLAENPEIPEKLGELQTPIPEQNPVEVVADGWDQDFSTDADNVKPGEEKGEGEGEGEGEGFPHPVRPGEPDCAYYMRTGGCRYGLNCKFNHPASRIKIKVKSTKLAELGQGVEEKEKKISSEIDEQTESKIAAKEKKGTFSESNGQIECKYFLTPGGCKYGNDCRFLHQEKTEGILVELNFLGLPMRPGEKECTYYMRTGGCKYSTNCRYHHPDPTAVGQQVPSGYQNGGSAQQHALPAQIPMASWPMQGNPNEPVPYIDASSSFVPGFYLQHHLNPQWNGYQAPVNPPYPTEMHMQHPSLASNMTDTKRKPSVSIPKKVQTGEYPERPGQPECQFFMKTGSCKFKGACKFHHPKSRLPKTPAVDLNPVGLPLRPDQTVCIHYSRHGICKFGLSCRYNHPMDGRASAPPVAVTVSSQNDFGGSSNQSQLRLETESSSNGVNQESEW